MSRNKAINWCFLFVVIVTSAQKRGPYNENIPTVLQKEHKLQPKIVAFSCESIYNEKLLLGEYAIGTRIVIAYQGGNGRQYPKQVIRSTGVTGLTAVLEAGTLAKGAGSIQYRITGKPNGIGIAKFKISMGDKTCTLQQKVSIYHNGFYYGTVTTKTGRTWLDRNLGASRVAKSVDDHMAYGHRFQWGRGADGHEVVNWRNEKDTIQTVLPSITPTLAERDTVSHTYFIATDFVMPNDWRASKNDSLWQGVKGKNNPCPENFRLPTKKEWEAELKTWKRYAGYHEVFKNSALKLTVGRSISEDGSLTKGPLQAWYWSSKVTHFRAFLLILRSGKLDDGPTLIVGSNRSGGNAVRCIKDE